MPNLEAASARSRTGYARPLVAAAARARTGYARPLVGIGGRVRTGTVTAVQIVTSAKGGRYRTSAVVGMSNRHNSSGTAARVRGGSAYVSLPKGSAPAPGPDDATTWGNQLVAWRFDDPVTSAAYVFEVNPNEGGTPTRKRKITRVPTTAVDGKPLVFEGQEEVMTMEFKGVILNLGQYDAFKTWFAKSYAVLLTNDLGQRLQVRLESFVPVRAPKVGHPNRHTYTCACSVLSGGTS